MTSTGIGTKDDPWLLRTLPGTSQYQVTKFPGNPTRSYRTRQPLRVLGEIIDWEPHPPEMLEAMRNHLEELKRLGIEAIND